jgi:hypothetical protein
MSAPKATSRAARAKAFLLGKARDIRDPSLFHNLSLLIDYALTITLSIASGADALFSFLPPGWRPLRLAFAVAGVLVESVLPLIPIFLLFLATHIFAIFYALAGNAPAIGSLAGSLSTDMKSATGELGTFGSRRCGRRKRRCATWRSPSP